MADTGTSCPANWMLHGEPVRGYGRKVDRDLTCDPVLIPVTMNYSLISGRINAYQRGWSPAFTFSVYNIPTASIDSSY